jgi:hypothetical protein
MTTPNQPKTLQQQGVPWRSNLKGSYFRKSKQPAVRNQYVKTYARTPSGSQTTTTHYSVPDASGRGGRGQSRVRDYSPVNLANKSTGGVGLLEGEFVICLGLLVLLMFANSTSSYGEKVMSIMKRGSLVCLLFFLLAIISTVGPNAERIAKAFGALMIVFILITSPVNTVVTDIDNLIKNDWVGSNETGNDTAPSADSGTSGGTSSEVQNAVNNSLATLGDSAVSATEAWLLHLSGPAATTVNNTVKSVLSKLHL